MQGAQQNDQIQANSDELATCQCIIAHPEKPKFLAIKHTTGFRPPQIMVPMDAELGTNAPRVIEAVQSKYGLRTTLLRHLALYRDYHCVELEPHGSDGRAMRAIWVGLEDYRRMQEGDLVPQDPLARWLEERERGQIPAVRPPWERAGWYKAVAHWIGYQMDLLNIQATGSVQQQRALVHASAILRAPAAGGDLWLKAGYAKAPLEARLIAFLSDVWPEHVLKPLAAEESRNWMLMPDCAEGAGSPTDLAGLERAAGSMGRLQAESVEHLDRLRELGCEAQGTERLREFLLHPDLAHSVPGTEEISLSEAEREELATVAARLAGLCDELAACGVPDLLVHTDFRAANISVGPADVRFINWENACIAPPAFCLLELLLENRPAALVNLQSDPIVRAWLDPLQSLAGRESWIRALILSARLQHGWRLMRWSQEFSWFEPGSVAELNARRFVVGLVHQLLEAERRH